MNTTAAPISDDALATILEQAFDFKGEHEGKIHVVKASGKIADDEALRTSFVRQVITMRRDLGLKVVVAHGAGKQIDRRLEQAGKISRKENGLRVTQADHVGIIDETVNAVNATLCETFSRLSKGYINPVGLAGHAPELNMRATPMDAAGDNFSGESVADFNRWYLEYLLTDPRQVPVITNMCANTQTGSAVRAINVNADSVASELAIGLSAHRLLMCSDVPGVKNKAGDVIPEIRENEVGALASDGTLAGGMLVKVREAFKTAARMGPDSAVIIMDDKFLVELLTPKGRGTMFRATGLKI